MVGSLLSSWLGSEQAHRKPREEGKRPTMQRSTIAGLLAAVGLPGQEYVPA